MADQCQALRELPLLSGNRVLAIGVASSRPSSPSSVTAFFGLLLFFPAGVSPGGRPLRFTAGIGAGVSCPASCPPSAACSFTKSSPSMTV
jgi:hypothetical protein